VFVDESGVTTDLLRRYGRSPRGVRLRDYTPCGHWQTHTIIAALRVEGLQARAVFVLATVLRALAAIDQMSGIHLG
jgi:hypothetical protein